MHHNYHFSYNYLSSKGKHILWMSILTVILTPSRSDIVQLRYFGTVVCDVIEKVNAGCALQHLKARSITECVTHCSRDDNCIGASMDDKGLCFKHYPCPSIKECTTENTDHVYISKKCDNGGEYLPLTKSCQCVNTWVGPICQQRARDCKELMTYGYPEGNYKTFLDPEKDGKDLIPVFCWIVPKTGFQFVGILNHQGRTDFNLTWDVSRNGFIFNESLYWIGLEHWASVSKLGYNKLFLVFDFGDSGSLYRQYFAFTLRGASDNYSFTHGNNWDNGGGSVEQSGSKVMDCFGPFKDTAFSAWDRDNVQNGDENCAASAGYGWWWSQGCTNACNIFGWGRDYLMSKSSDELISAPGVDMESWLPKLKQIIMYVTP